MTTAEVEPERAPRGRVLVVDDDAFIRSSFSRILQAAGHEVEAFAEPAGALARTGGGRYDVVVSDLSMPGMGGLEFLEKLHATQADLPVVIVTAQPSVQSAVRALEGGAARYLTKPVEPAALCAAVSHALNLRRLAAIKREAQAVLGGRSEQEVRREAELEEAFSGGLRELWMAYQPVISCRSRAVVGYEALMRTRYPALPSPMAFLEVAERLERLDTLGRRVRELAAQPFEGRAGDQRLYVNLHPRDLLDATLYDPEMPLCRMARSVVLEVTERAAVHDLDDAAGRVARLRALGFAIAIDDVGAGYAGLSSIALLEPEVIKLDMSLTRDIDRRPTQQRLVRSMVDVARDLGAELIVEGVETSAEFEVLASLGCDLMQGYLFARPGPAFPVVSLPAPPSPPECVP